MSGANLRTPGTDNPGGRDRSRKHCSRETGTAGTEGKKPAPQVSQTRDRICRHRKQGTRTASITDERPDPQAPQARNRHRKYHRRERLRKRRAESAGTADTRLSASLRAVPSAETSVSTAGIFGGRRSRTGLNGKPERGEHQPWENITRSPIVHSPAIGVYASPRTARHSPEDKESSPPDNEQRQSARCRTDQTQDTETL